MKNPETLSEAVTLLQQDGYTEDFNIQSNCVECKNLDLKISPEEFLIDKFYRFEGDTDPDDEEVVYAISSDKHKLKGILVAAFGKDADALSTDTLRKIKMREHL